jgi:hypothetical protein
MGVSTQALDFLANFDYLPLMLLTNPPNTLLSVFLPFGPSDLAREIDVGV